MLQSDIWVLQTICTKCMQVEIAFICTFICLIYLSNSGNIAKIISWLFIYVY